MEVHNSKILDAKYSGCFVKSWTLNCYLFRNIKFGHVPAVTRPSLLVDLLQGYRLISRKQNAQNKWSLQKEGFVGRQLTEALRGSHNLAYWIVYLFTRFLLCNEWWHIFLCFCSSLRSWSCCLLFEFMERLFIIFWHIPKINTSLQSALMV